MKTNNEQKTQPKKMFFPPNRFRSCVPYNWCVQCSTSYSAFLYIFFSICFGLLRAHFRFIYKRWLLVRHNYLRVLFCSLACSLSAMLTWIFFICQIFWYMQYNCWKSRTWSLLLFQTHNQMSIKKTCFVVLSWLSYVSEKSYCHFKYKNTSLVMLSLPDNSTVAKQVFRTYFTQKW